MHMGDQYFMMPLHHHGQLGTTVQDTLCPSSFMFNALSLSCYALLLLRAALHYDTSRSSRMFSFDQVVRADKQL